MNISLINQVYNSKNSNKAFLSFINILINSIINIYFNIINIYLFYLF